MSQGFEVLVKKREGSHLKNLKCFKQDKSLETLSQEVLETRLLKSFGINFEEVACMFRETFNTVELVRLMHLATEEANKMETHSLK